MAAKLLYTNSKIFFSNPTVIRVEYSLDHLSEEEIYKAHRKIHRATYKVIQGTWGYSGLRQEEIMLSKEENTNVMQKIIGGFHPGQVHFISSTNYRYVKRGYFCFQDELDVLQFRLTVDTKAIKVDMWPDISFTIHELSESAVLTPYNGSKDVY